MYYEIICFVRFSVIVRFFKFLENFGKEFDEMGIMVEVWDGYFSLLIFVWVWVIIVIIVKLLVRESGDIILIKD